MSSPYLYMEAFQITSSIKLEDIKVYKASNSSSVYSTGKEYCLNHSECVLPATPQITSDTYGALGETEGLADDSTDLTVLNVNEETILNMGTMIVTVEENNLGEKTPLCEITNTETPTVPLSIPKDFRSYLIAVGGCLMDYPEGKDENLALIMEIDRISSNARGVKGVPPVFIHKHLGKPADPPQNGVNPHAILFSDGPKLSCMLILGGVLNFKNIKVDNLCDAILNLIAVNYVIQLGYPASYFVLDIIDRYYFPKADVDAPLVRKSKRSNKNAKKEFQCITNFLTKFNKFLVDNCNDHTGTVKPAPNIYERDVIVRKAKAVGLKFKAVSASNILRPLLENYAHENVILPDPTNLQRVWGKEKNAI
ncbi:hypothetical protein DAPPUDRAFT_113862 [Daphnia pulex]|uniref:Uncharacterized protein n=1 Tax=Daphnia pulex TaxID=6669 RepID=E9HGB3_DAPPU|nr:hypothetical protein DAPPUDRAFT_113862 [Daphnia pulex]|eukprot:EFX69194.1 hypothetical protein DAPPUDRAFT_113862 [Daphnia pulex]